MRTHTTAQPPLQHANPLYDLPLGERNIGRFLRLRAVEDGERPYLTIGGTTYTRCGGFFHWFTPLEKGVGAKRAARAAHRDKSLTRNNYLQNNRQIFTRFTPLYLYSTRSQLTPNTKAMTRFIMDLDVLKRLAPFSWFSETHLARALPTVEHRCYPARTLIQSSGQDSDGLYIVLAGRVSVIHEDADAHELLVTSIGPRDFFGELGLFEEHLCAASVRSEEPCEFLFIPRKVVLECLEDNARAAMCMLHKIVGRFCETHDKLAHLALATVEQRVAMALVENSVEAGGEWRVEVGSEKISSIVAASREMVSRVLKKLIGEGLVRRDGRKLLIVDRDAVAMRARRAAPSVRHIAGAG